jgi:glycosyltransferase involved in cell wall biosynthesis
VASIVVIAHNEENTLLSCLWSLSENICDFPIEIIGVNNNSTDRTAEIFDALGVPWFWEERKSCGYARQCGLNHARGKYYISIDSDILYPPKYVQTMVDCLREPGIVAVSSRYSYIPDKKHSKVALTIYEFLRDKHIFLQSINRPEISVRGGVLAYDKELGLRVGYRVEIKVGEDGSMALGLKKYGRIKLINDRKARAMTFTRTLDAKGSIFYNLKAAALRYLKSPSRYFIKKEKYDDVESNLLNH